MILHREGTTMNEKKKEHKPRKAYNVICYFDRKTQKYIVEIPSEKKRCPFNNIAEAIDFIELVSSTKDAKD